LARGLVLGASLSLVAAACDASLTNDRSPHEHVASASCPLKTPDEWQAFLEATVDEEGWVRTCSSLHDCDALSGELRVRVETEVLGTFARCSDDLAQNPRIRSCTERLRRFAPAWVRQHTAESYGFMPENADYFAAQLAPERPAGMMDPPPELLAALPERVNIEGAARDNGWPYLTHDSCVGGVRTFIVRNDPDERFEQWMLVGLEGASIVPEGSILSLIAIQKKDAEGRPLDDLRLHFRDYVLSRLDDSFAAYLPDAHDAKCYACHPSGMRTLLHRRGDVLASAPVRGEPGYPELDVSPAFAFGRLVELNERLRSYGAANFSPDMNPGDLGPPLGKTLGCTECHDGIARGVLTVMTDEAQIEQKVVAELSMGAFSTGKVFPDERLMALVDRERIGNPPLTDEERTELELARAERIRDFEELEAERFPAWRAWALEAPCTSSAR
jgi:hypothetical protein